MTTVQMTMTTTMMMMMMMAAAKILQFLSFPVVCALYFSRLQLP
jgi:hypothetical protein